MMSANAFTLRDVVNYTCVSCVTLKKAHSGNTKGEINFCLLKKMKKKMINIKNIVGKTIKRAVMDEKFIFTHTVALPYHQPGETKFYPNFSLFFCYASFILVDPNKKMAFNFIFILQSSIKFEAENKNKFQILQGSIYCQILTLIRFMGCLPLDYFLVKSRFKNCLP